MAFALAPLGNRMVGNSPQTAGNFNNVNGIGNTVVNNNINNIDQSINDNSTTIHNHYHIDLGGQDKPCKGGKGKGKAKAGKGKGCNKGRRGRRGGKPQSPQQMMMRLMGMMMKLMQQMSGGNQIGGCGQMGGGVNLNIGGFRPPGFL